MSIEKRETYHLLKEGPHFRKRLLHEATSMVATGSPKLSNEDFTLALQEFQRQAGIKK
jgi:hypothetical protein